MDVGNNLAGRCALVTGASRGIGATIARRLAEAGLNVTCLARDRADLERTVARIRNAGGQASAAVGSVLDEEFVSEVVAGMRGVDVLVNNAGINFREPVGEIDIGHARQILEVNVLGVVICTNLFAARMLREDTKGSIITISSTQGHRAGPGRAVYTASKHAVEGFTKSVGVELAPHGISCSAIAPTWVYTDMSAAKLDDAQNRAAIEATIPAGRITDPDEVADMVIFLASDTARFLTGSSLHLDGGMTC